MRSRCPMLVLLILPIFSGVGCAAFKTAGQQAMEGALGYINESVVPALKDEAKKALSTGLAVIEAKVDAKIAEKERDVLADLDAELEQVAEKDPDTGVAIAKTWRDFDSDRDGNLQPGEYAKAKFYIGKKALASGDFGLMGDAAKGGAGGIAVLAAAEFMRRRRRNGKKNGSKPPDPAAPPAGGAAPAPSA